MGKRRKKQRPQDGVNEQHTVVQRKRGKARRDVVLSIVYTDSTFFLHDDKVLSPVWVGACIHCRRKIAVTESGATGATIEHVVPKCAGGSEDDPKNLALACAECNHEKGRRHDKYVGKGGRADDVISALQGTRLSRWREPVV